MKVKNLTFEKHQFVKAPKDPFYEQEGIIGFQLVTFKYNVFGKEMEDTYDTKILKDGTQKVIDGGGWIPAGTIVK